MPDEPLTRSLHDLALLIAAFGHLLGGRRTGHPGAQLAVRAGRDARRSRARTP